MNRVTTDAKCNVQVNDDETQTEDKDEYLEKIVDYTDGALKFIEKYDLMIDHKFEYQRVGVEPGLVLIFNQENFSGQSFREGSRKDVTDIITCLSRLGYNITKKNVFNDLDSDEILAQIDQVLSEDLSHVNCVIVFFLTHGLPNNILYTRYSELSADRIWKKFANCTHLVGKPKVFLFQACKGETYTHNEYSQKLGYVPTLVPPYTFTTDYIGRDMLIVYSTIEDKVSLRYTKEGSWFIQELCKNFSTYGRRDDITSLIIRTTKCVCNNHFDDPARIIKQMPLFISTLTKKFYLTRSKDRSWVIQNRQQLDATHDLTESLIDDINSLHQVYFPQMKKEKRRNK